VTAETDAALDFVQALLPLGVGSVDRLEELPARVSVVFDWDVARAAALVANEPDGARVVRAFAAAVAAGGALDREAFRAAAAGVRAETGLKGRALFHPLRVALTAADSGPELDLAVPAIDRGAALPESSGVRRVLSCAARAAAIAQTIGP
jgi:nondiscriminating glutamyl-tRNA synthetase